MLLEIPGIFDLLNNLTFPDFSHLSNPDVYKIVIVLTVVTSLETLLSVEAADKQDPYNRELKAQGLENLVSGLIGGLPITQVVVRTSANISFGAKSKLSTILHGFFLLISVVSIVSLINMIPLASLAAILIMVGYKLTKPSLFKWMYALGWEQFLPFMVTVVVMLVTDLLTGVMFGLVASNATAIHLHQKPVKKVAVEPKTKRKPSRPKKGEKVMPKKPTILAQQQEMQTTEELLCLVSTQCSVGIKKNAKGNTEKWIGGKLHISAVDGDIPVTAIYTGQ